MKALGRLTLGTLILTFIMITLGGVVHNTASSLACPDWPLCYGQVFPKMQGAIAIEHSHRLLGTLIGILCIGIAVLGTRQRKHDAKLAKVCWLALALVIFQGVLGGVTVLLQLSPIVSVLHLATSQIFMGTLLYILLRDLAGVNESEGRTAAIPGQIVPASVRKGLGLALGLVFLQMLLGAAIRHGGAGVACGLGPAALFLCRDSENAARLWPDDAPAKLHMLHRYFSLIAVAMVIAGTMPFLKWIKRTAPRLKSLRLLIVSAHGLVTLQVLLGLATVLTSIALVPVTLHLVTAMLLCFVLLSLNFIAAGRITT